MARRATLGALIVFAVVAAILWIPWATQERVVIAPTPVPAPLFGITPIPFKGGATACQQNVTFNPHTQIAEIGVTTGGKPGPPLAITADARGYHARSSVPGGYRDNPALRFNLAAPPSAVIGKLCMKNTGRAGINLDGTGEFRTMGRPSLAIDGVPVPVDAKLVFYARSRSSYLSRVGQIFGHAATFTPAFFSKAVLIALALLALVGIPVAIALAYSAAVRADDEEST